MSYAEDTPAHPTEYRVPRGVEHADDEPEDTLVEVFGHSEARPGDRSEAGDILGNYRILGRIGEGGMGIVYRAEHRRLGRKVALKMLRHEFVRRPNAVQRFFEEARVVNEIGHPSNVDIIDFVEEWERDPPRVYFVMELLSGVDLADYIEAPLEPKEAVEILDPVLRALHEAHARGIVHRDLKCANIFLHQGPDGRRIVKVLDFGLAKPFGQRRDAKLTEAGMIVGTPEYMAPEQVLGDPLDPRTDVYAAGVVLYHVLAGAAPFDAKEVGKILIQQVRDRPQPINRRRTKPIAPAVEAVVMRCLEKKPAARYASAEHLRQALWESLRARRWRPRDLMLLAVTSLLVVAAAVLAWRAGPRSPSGGSTPQKTISAQVHLAPRLDAAPKVAPSQPSQRRAATITGDAATADTSVRTANNPPPATTHRLKRRVVVRSSARHKAPSWRTVKNGRRKKPPPKLKAGPSGRKTIDVDDTVNPYGKPSGSR